VESGGHHGRRCRDGRRWVSRDLAWLVAGGNVGARRSAVVLLHLQWKARPLVPTAEDGDADLWGQRRWSRGREDVVRDRRMALWL
jgi:hypothetical protein